MPQQDNKGSVEHYSIESLKAVRAPGFVSVYSNSANVASSFHDLRLVFSQMIKVRDDPPFLEDQVAVTMTWEHAFALKELLDRIVTDYEDLHGNIRRKPLLKIETDPESTE